MAAVCLALGLLGVDTEAGLRWARTGVEQSRSLEFDWLLGIGLTFEGIHHAIAGDAESAQARYAEGLEIQERLGDCEGAGMSLGGLAQLAVGRGDLSPALELYRRSLGWFEAVGDRAEEARILSEIGWAHIADDDAAAARRHFFEAVQAHTDVASVRGVGHALIGLAAAEVLDDRPDQAVQIAAAAEMYAKAEGIVVIYSDETPGRELVDRARAALSADDLARLTDAGRRLTIEQALTLPGV